MGQRDSALQHGDQRAFDLLAAMIDGLSQFEAQVGLFELIRLDLERAGELAAAGLLDDDAIRADRRGGIKRDRLVERAELVELHRSFEEIPAAHVGDRHRVRFDRVDRVATAFHFADDAAELDFLAGSIRGSIGVKIGARAQALRDRAGMPSPEPAAFAPSRTR